MLAATLLPLAQAETPVTVGDPAAPPLVPWMQREERALQRAIDDRTLRARVLRLDAQSDLRVLNVAAHPDDEDGATLVTLRFLAGAATHILYMTRGEGGQNETGPELDDELGALRSRECQAAAEGYGASISFLNCLDFGFAKHASEALQRWGQRDTMARLLAELRLLDADIIVTHHTPGEGHGHHRATSVLLRQACRELTRLGDPAAPAVLLESTDAPDSATVSLDRSRPAPGTAWTCAGRAHVALRRHRCQGMALEHTPERIAPARYRAVDGVGDPAAIATWAAQSDPFSPAGMARLVPAHADRNATSLRATAARIEAGRTLRVVTGPPITLPLVAPGLPVPQPAMGWIRIAAPAPASLDTVELVGPLPAQLAAAVHSVARGFEVALRAEAGGRPDWPTFLDLRSRRTVADSLALRLVFHDGTSELRQVVLPPRGLRARFMVELPLAPAVAGQTLVLHARWAGLAPPEAPLTLQASCVAAGQRLAADTQVVGPPWRSTPRGFFETIRLPLAACDAADSAELSLTYPGCAQVLRTPIARLRVPPALQIGLISGVDSMLVQQLTACGLAVTCLSDRDLAQVSPQRFVAIVLDPRVYALRPELRSANARLLAYARAGGHLVVQYHKDFDWQPTPDEESLLPPLPLHVGQKRVVDEGAPVTLLRPDHPFFHTPNELAPTDWDGWVQERGLYFPDRWDPGYAALVRMADAGEAPLDGGILCARVGRGAYTYTSLAFWRQLRVAEPGALRIFINLLCWPLAP